MLVRIFTAFPEYFELSLSISLLGKKEKDGIWKKEIINLRDYGIGKHKKIDDTTAGGGIGLILRPDVLGNALEDKIPDAKNGNIFLTSPRGVKFNQKLASECAKLPEFNIICNRFEGVDQRVIDYYNIKEISIGDYILLGGEVAVCVILEATLRLIDGFLDPKVLEDESFGSSLDGGLEYPHYTNPDIWHGIEIPRILKSGDHAKIKKWRDEKRK